MSLKTTMASAPSQCDGNRLRTRGGDSLVGVTYECDYPVEVGRLQKLTRSNIPPGLSSEQIETVVSVTLDATGSLYELDLPLLEALQPDIILTQRLPVTNDRPDNGGFPRASEITYLVRGEPPTMVALNAKIELRVHWRVHMPEYREEVQV